MIDWENNEGGLPAPDLGLGEDGKPRRKYTEEDLAIIAANPITLVAVDAAHLSMGQVMQIGYKPPPGIPQGLSMATLLAAFVEISRRIERGEIVVTQAMKEKYSYVYSVESIVDKN